MILVKDTVLVVSGAPAESDLPFTSAIQYHPKLTRRTLESRGKPVSVSIWISNKRVACFSSISARMVWCGVMDSTSSLVDFSCMVSQRKSQIWRGSAE